MISRRDFVLGLTCMAPLFFVGRSLASPWEELQRRLSAQSQFHTLLVQKGDDVIFSAAAPGHSYDRMANIKSCSKSLLGLMLGAAIDRGHINSVKQPLSEVMPKRLPENVSSIVANITLEELVTLTAPLMSTSGGNYGRWIHSPDWVEYVLQRPDLEHTADTMVYSTGATHVLGAALTEATGQSLHALAREYLGEPLEISIPPWTRDPQGYYFGGNNMAMTPRAMLRIAAMVRDNGQWKDQQVISSNWMMESMMIRAYSPWSGLGYGYGWFITDSGYALARGYGGQIIAAHKEKDLAVAITSDPNRPATSDGYFGELLSLLDGPILAMG